jgi:hypothetical protein
LTFTHLFSSHLQRAAKTAGKIREAQSTSANDGNTAKAAPDVMQLPGLMEQDFGSKEGKKFHDRVDNKDTPGFVEVESKDSMAHRAESFLDEHLLPLLGEVSEDTDPVVAIVSHGIFLSTLRKRLLLRLPHKSVALSPELQATARPSLEHLGGWSNTGYLELYMTRVEPDDQSTTAEVHTVPVPEPSSLPAETPPADQGLGEVKVPQAVVEHGPTSQQMPEAPIQAVGTASSTITPRIARKWSTTILAINGKDHLRGLKRTRGGVGSSRHDTSQKSIETFFKRRKAE